MNDAMNDAINDAMMEGEEGEGGDDDGVESYHEEDEPMGTDVEESLSDGMEVDAAADEAASERREWELACKLCSYASTGNSFTEQHWYYCYTCGLTESEGCCSICVKVCHKGHDVSYSRRSRFFCDCGAGAGATRGLSCSALAPRAFVPGEGGASQDSQTSQHACCAAAAAAAASSAAPAAPSPTPSAPVTDTSGGELVVSEAQRAELLAVLGEGGAGGFVASLYATYAWQLRQLQKAAPREAPADEEELFSTSKAASVSSSLVQPWTTVRAGSFDVKVKSEVAHHRELRTLLGTGVIARQLIAATGRGHTALAEGEKIPVLDSAPAMRAPAAAAPVERGSLRATAKPSVGFEVLQLNFNSADETQLLVSGLKECVALTLGERGELVSRISIDLMLDTLGLGLPVHILRTAWLPGSVSRCYVLTNQFIKVYDLAKDKICPQYYYQVLEDAIKDVAFAPTGADGTLTLLALTGSGVLYRQPLVAESGGGPLALCDAIPVPSELRGRVGASLHFSTPTGLLFASYADGKCFGLRLGGAATEVVGGFALHAALPRHVLPPPAAPRRPRRRRRVGGGVGGVDDAVPALGGRGGAARRAHRHVSKDTAANGRARHADRTSGAAAPPRRQGRGPAAAPRSRAPKAAAAAAAAASAAAYVVWALGEDGALHAHQGGAGVRSEEATLAAVRDELSVRPREAAKFPVDFFERSTLVTPASDILFSGDALQTTNQGVIKQRLSATSDEYVSATSKASLTLSVNNQNSEQLVVGVRVLLGAAHAQHIPATVSVFGRAIATQEGRRRWYDVPLTAAEAVLGHKTLPITFGATHTGAHIPVVDSIEVYAQSKSDFGWDAQLAALAAKHSASSGADGDGGHAIKEAALPPPHATMLRSLVSSLRQLVGFHGAAAAAPPPPHLRDEMVGALPSVFTLGAPFSALRGPCKLLLRQLEPDAARYHALKDHAQLSHALRALTDADGNGGDGGASGDKSGAQADDAQPARAHDAPPRAQAAAQPPRLPHAVRRRPPPLRALRQVRRAPRRRRRPLPAARPVRPIARPFALRRRAAGGGGGGRRGGAAGGAARRERPPLHFRAAARAARLKV